MNNLTKTLFKIIHCKYRLTLCMSHMPLQNILCTVMHRLDIKIHSQGHDKTAQYTNARKQGRGSHKENSLASREEQDTTSPGPRLWLRRPAATRASTHDAQPKEDRQARPPGGEGVAINCSGKGRNETEGWVTWRWVQCSERCWDLIKAIVCTSGDSLLRHSFVAAEMLSRGLGTWASDTALLPNVFSTLRNSQTQQPWLADVTSPSGPCGRCIFPLLAVNKCLSVYVITLSALVFLTKRAVTYALRCDLDERCSVFLLVYSWNLYIFNYFFWMTFHFIDQKDIKNSAISLLHQQCYHCIFNVCNGQWSGI